MTIEITRPGKHSLFVETPVMPAAGTFGFGDVYQNLVKVEKLGAVVTNPVTYEPWFPAGGARVVPLDAGVLVHTGLPNPGLSTVLKTYRSVWRRLPVPVILHLVATSVDHVRKSVSRLDNEETINAIELGLNEDITWKETADLVKAAVSQTEKPVLARLPMQDAYEIADAAVESGADALVVAAPPRGTARDPLTGRLVSGRVYGPLVKPVVLHIVGRLVRRIDIPIIAAGGIHSQQDARDYLEAGAVAIQVDSVIWIQPHILEHIGRDMGGWVITRPAGAYPDEWHPGMGETEEQQRQKKRDTEDKGKEEDEKDADEPSTSS